MVERRCMEKLKLILEIVKEKMVQNGVKEIEYYETRQIKDPRQSLVLSEALLEYTLRTNERPVNVHDFLNTISRYLLLCPPECVKLIFDDDSSENNENTYGIICWINLAPLRQFLFPEDTPTQQSMPHTHYPIPFIECPPNDSITCSTSCPYAHVLLHRCIVTELNMELVEASTCMSEFKHLTYMRIRLLD